ncbi:MAG TPA: regulator [Chitinophagaceae bacterium]|nr:regulator [Chitinophagaceae bacterium]HAN40147.1 regulator [Chitinophagaceae bacterium]
MKPNSLLIHIVEDDTLYGAMLRHYLQLNPDYTVKLFTTAKEFKDAVTEKPDIITLDYSLPDATATEVIDYLKERLPDTKVIIISGQNNIQVAIDLLKKGAHDYLVKDAETQERLWMAIQKLQENVHLQKQVKQLQNEVEKKYAFSNSIVGNSAATRRVFALMEKAVTTNITVSISGETGTGKELVAKSIHFNSNRKKFGFVPVNVAAIPKDLIESELFGHEKGAFTGAIGRRIGKFEEAHQGTLFLDEIGEMDISLQAKLLRALQEKEITRIGSNENIKVDVRIIVATHKNLEEEVQKGNFRQDLYYRLLGLPIHLPPLRERDSDVILIAKHCIEQFCKENSMPEKILSVETRKKLMLMQFPGNIRQLKSVVELACVLCDGMEIEPEHIQETPSGNGLLYLDNLTKQGLTLRQYTTKLIQHYLDIHDYDVLHVADLLDIGKSTIYRMINNNELVLQKR